MFVDLGCSRRAISSRSKYPTRALELHLRICREVLNPSFRPRRSVRGTGLGLSMVYGFFKQSNGRISVSSELGKGTTFRMFVPRARAGEATGIKFVSAPTLPRESCGH